MMWAKEYSMLDIDSWQSGTTRSVIQEFNK